MEVAVRARRRMEVIQTVRKLGAARRLAAAAPLLFGSCSTA